MFAGVWGDSHTSSHIFYKILLYTVCHMDSHGKVLLFLLLLRFPAFSFAAGDFFLDVFPKEGIDLTSPVSRSQVCQCLSHSLSRLYFQNFDLAQVRIRMDPCIRAVSYCQLRCQCNTKIHTNSSGRGTVFGFVGMSRKFTRRFSLAMLNAHVFW